jgi:hypothetical protein
LRRLAAFAGFVAVACAAAFVIGLRSRPVGPSRAAAPARPMIGGGSVHAEAQRSSQGPVARRPFFAPPSSPLDPRSASYNPLALRAVGKSTREVFANEPRHDAWAVQMETLLRSDLERDVARFFPAHVLQIEAIECRTSSCEIRVLVESARAQEAMLFLQSVPVGSMNQAWTQELTDEGTRVRVGYTSLFEPIMRDPDFYRRHFPPPGSFRAIPDEGWSVQKVTPAQD